MSCECVIRPAKFDQKLAPNHPVNADVMKIYHLLNIYAAEHLLLSRDAEDILEKIRNFRIAEVDGEFAGCAALEKVNLPVRLERIGAEAFRDCVSLRTLEIPAGVSTIGVNAFTGCSRLKIYADKKSAAYEAAKRDHVRRRTGGSL